METNTIEGVNAKLAEPTSWHSYPKIYNLGHAAVVDLFDGPVVVEEKVDGSQFSFGVFNGELKFRSKGKQMEPDAPEKMFTLAVEAVKAVKDKLVDGWTYRGEYLQKPKHNSLCYERIPKNHIALFDINCGEESYIGPEAKEQEAKRLGFEVVPCYKVDRLEKPEDVKALLENTSFLGGVKIEGVVIKNYMKFGLDKKVLMGKFVSEDFKEIHKKEWAKQNPATGDFIEVIAQNHRTKARWMKAVQAARDRGELTDSPQDIGKLLNAVRDDILAEEKDAIASELFNYAWDKIISRKVVAGFPEWYKEYLMEKQFGTKPEVVAEVA